MIGILMISTTLAKDYLWFAFPANCSKGNILNIIIFPL